MLNQPPIDSLHDQLIRASQKQITGRLQIQSDRGKRWELYFCVGYLTWVSGDWHRVRRLRRQLRNHDLKVDWKTLTLRDRDEFFTWDFQIIQILKKRNLISEDQVRSLVNSIAIETLFDVLYAGMHSNLDYIVDPQEDTLSFLRGPSLKLNIDWLLLKVEKQIETWVQAGFSSVSPNDAPIMKDRNKMKSHNLSAYQKIGVKLNGKITLRELSWGFKIETLKFTRFLTPYIKKGWIELIEVPDIAYNIVTKTSVSSAKSPKEPLVVCVDDSSQTIQTIEPIVKAAGYRFLAIQDSLKAILMLIEAKPDLIFLDLVMPVANGYEICTQLRRTVQFSRTPIVILTSNKGTMSRLRASAVKATDFLTKPVQPQKILEVIRKYLETSSPPKSQ